MRFYLGTIKNKAGLQLVINRGKDISDKTRQDKASRLAAVSTLNKQEKMKRSHFLIIQVHTLIVPSRLQYKRGKQTASITLHIRAIPADVLFRPIGLDRNVHLSLFVCVTVS
jgi:hypothetical protein